MRDECFGLIQGHLRNIPHTHTHIHTQSVSHLVSQSALSSSMREGGREGPWIRPVVFCMRCVICSACCLESDLDCVRVRYLISDSAVGVTELSLYVRTAPASAQAN